MAKALKLPVIKNSYRIEGDVAFLTINCQKHALETQVEVKDLARIGKYRWYGAVSGSAIYVHARPSNGRGGRLCLQLHRLVCGLKKGDGKDAHHRFGNTLDNRRSQLQVLTPIEHAEKHRRYYAEAA